MQGLPNRMGLGLRPPPPSYGQGPSIQALAQQQHLGAPAFGVPPGAQRATNLFVGSIAAGISDGFLNSLLAVRAPLPVR
jgi:RNA-binding protein 25